MFKRLSGKPNVEFKDKKASTTFINGGLTYADGAGGIQPADATSGNHTGIILRDVLATDADYAAKAKVPVDVAGPNDLFEVDVPNGDLAVTDVEKTCDLMPNGAGIDPDATSKNVVTIVGFISPSKAIVKINAMQGVANVATT